MRARVDSKAVGSRLALTLGVPQRTFREDLTRFHSRSPPGISVVDYLRRIVRYTNIEVRKSLARACEFEADRLTPSIQLLHSTEIAASDSFALPRRLLRPPADFYTLVLDGPPFSHLLGLCRQQGHLRLVLHQLALRKGRRHQS